MTETTETTIESLFVSPIGRPAHAVVNGWVRRHNTVVTAFLSGHANDLRRSERAILSLVAAIDQYAGSMVDGVDPYSGENVYAALLDGFGHALNYDLGRLDGGTLSGWEHRMRARVGIDENGGWVG